MLGTDVCALLRNQEVAFVPADVDEFDIADASAAMSFIARCVPAAIINCAAYTAVDQAESEPEIAFRVNRDGSRNLAEAARSFGCHFVHVSTDYVFDGGKDSAYTEEDRPKPLGVYGASKLAGEEAVREALPHYCIIRTAWLYGVNGKSFPRTILDLKRAGKAVRVVTDQVGSPTYASHLAAVLIEAAQKAFVGTYHAVGSGTCSWYEFARDVLSAAGFSPDIEPLTTPELPRPARRPANSVLSTRKLEQRHGLRLPPWQEGVREFVRHWRSERG